MPTSIRFYLDEHIHRAVAQRLRERGIDVLRAQESGLLGADDKSHLNFARRQRRVIVTGDTDFLRLDGQGVRHSGIVFIRNVQAVGKVIETLILIYESLDSDEMSGHVEYW